jgi:hypothetical protein
MGRRDFKTTLIHEPGRLAILTVLSSVKDADFVFLQRCTGLTKETSPAT